MPIKADFHLHSAFSGDSQTPMEDMIQKALSLGLTELCFTEHMDLDFPVTPDTPAGMFEVDVAAYRSRLMALREKYAGQISLLFGIEMGLQPCVSDKNALLAEAYDFDFIIGSSHICRGRDPYFPSFYEGRSEEEAYREYFSSVLENLETYSDFDIYGHLDYVVRYGPRKDAAYTYEKYRDLLDAILTRLLEMGKGLEINTGALSYRLRELNPCSGILKKYRSLGGEIITVGSDAHTPDRLAAGFPLAADILKSCGFTHYCTFLQRKPLFHKL